MSDNQSDKPRTTRHVIATIALALVLFVAVYLAGFVVILKNDFELSPPVMAVLSVVYCPLIVCDINDIEPVNSMIEWLEQEPPLPPGNGKTMTVPTDPPPPAP